MWYKKKCWKNVNLEKIRIPRLQREVVYHFMFFHEINVKGLFILRISQRIMLEEKKLRLRMAILALDVLFSLSVKMSFMWPLFPNQLANNNIIINLWKIIKQHNFHGKSWPNAKWLYLIVFDLSFKFLLAVFEYFYFVLSKAHESIAKKSFLKSLKPIISKPCLIWKI